MEFENNTQVFKYLDLLSVKKKYISCSIIFFEIPAMELLEVEAFSKVMWLKSKYYKYIASIQMGHVLLPPSPRLSQPRLLLIW